MKTNKPNMQTKTSTKRSSKIPGSGSEHGFRSSNHQGEPEQQQQAQPDTKGARASFGAVTRKTFEALKAAAQWRGVFFHGPESDRNKDGDEVPTWIVYVGTKEGERVSRSYTCHSFERGAQLANVMATDRGIELINEAQPA